MLDLDPARWVCVIVRVEPQECSWLYWSETIMILESVCLRLAQTEPQNSVRLWPDYHSRPQTPTWRRSNRRRRQRWRHFAFACVTLRRTLHIAE